MTDSKHDPEDVAYTYHGDGAYLDGVPARDLTYADLAYLSPGQRRDVKFAEVDGTPVYAPVAAKKAPPAEGEKG